MIISEYSWFNLLLLYSAEVGENTSIMAAPWESPPPPTMPSKRKHCELCAGDDENGNTGPFSKLTCRGLQSLQESALERGDSDLYRTLDEIPAGGDSSHFTHRVCYRNYTEIEPQTVIDDALPEDVAFVNTRSKAKLTTSFCGGCGHRSYKKDEKLRPCKDPERFRRAAQTLHLNDVMQRVSNFDTAQMDILLHKGCYRNIMKQYDRASNKENKPDPATYDVAFNLLCDLVRSEIIQKRKPMTMKSLFGIYRQQHEQYYESVYAIPMRTMKNRILSHFGNDINIVSQRGQGQTPVIHSGDMTLNEAIKTIANSEESDCETDFHGESNGTADTEPNEKPDLDDEKLICLHNAVGIIRDAIARIPTDAKYYPAAGKISQEESESFVPVPLQIMVRWLIDDTAYADAATSSASEELKGQHELERRVTAISECIIYSSRAILTPFTLGLAAQLHHQYGSRDIVEELNKYGMCITYCELRHFLTSLAKHQLSEASKRYEQIDDYSREKNNIIMEGDDNCDLNPETLNGGKSFHQMARVVFQTKQIETVHNSNGSVSEDKIPRVKERSFPVSDTMNETTVMTYKIPGKRPEPPRVKAALATLKTLETHVIIPSTTP